MRCLSRALAVVVVSTPALLSSQSPVPAPDASFGFRAGADYKLATYDQSIGYFRQLDAASDRVRLVEVGRTSQGRPMVFALISSPENLANLEVYRRMNLQLAHPESLAEADARRIARDGKAFVHIDGGLHATEVAGPQHTPQLAYDLVSRAGDPETDAILDNVIVMLWPTINPDGQQMVAEWYMSNVGTPYELSGLPRLYQDYVGHDNNRDGYMLNMIESRVIEHAWRQWEPHIVYVHHQTGPFPSRIWLPPFSEPVGTHAPSLMSRQVNMIGMAIAKKLDERGQAGATHMGRAFDAWYPGYIDYAPIFKNVPAFWTETALYQYATPREYTIEDFPAEMRDLRAHSLYSSPWPPGWWRLRDAVEYMETASLATLEFAAKYKESLLFNRYLAGRDQIAKGRTKAPYAYFFPQDQRDPVAVVELLRRLAFGGVLVDQLTSPIAIDDQTYPAGTWVIRTDQEFAAMAREVLDVQTYPDLRQYPGGPPERPYDAAGWTLPLQMGVRMGIAVRPLTADERARMKRVAPNAGRDALPAPYPASTADAAPFDSAPGTGFDASAVAAGIVPREGRVTGSGPALAVNPAENNAFRAINQAWKRNATIAFVPARASSEARYVIGGLSPAAQSELVRALALTAARVPARTGTPVRRPRIGLFQPWSGSMDEGWTRWVLERFDFEYVTLRPDDFRAPLRDRVDVVILADDARLPVEGQTGSGRGGGRGGPGGRAVRPEYAYQLSPDDLQAFEQFVRAGGTVVCFGNASNAVIQQFKLPVRNVVAGLAPTDFFLRGSIVGVTVDTAHPVMAGMPEKAAVFVDGGPVFETLEAFRGTVLARYQDSGSPLRSGYLIGEKHLHGKAAAVDVQLDAGHVLLLGFRPQWRGQPFGTFRVLFNASLSPAR